MNIPCKVCQSEEAVNPQSEYPVCETCAVDFYETAMKAAQQGVQAERFAHYRKAVAGETNCKNCARSFHVWSRKGCRCGDSAYNQPVGKFMTCDAAQSKCRPTKRAVGYA